MKAPIILIFLAFIQLSFCAEKSVVFALSTSFRNSKFECKVSEIDLTNSPSWRNTDLDPPLSPGQAAGIAVTHLSEVLKQESYVPFINNETANSYKENLRWVAYSITLKRINQEKWIYIVECMSFAEMGADPPVKVIVLLNGKIIPLDRGSQKSEK